MMMAQCLSPIRIKREHGFDDVPCGRCGFCLQNRRKEWSFRLQKELRQHTSAFFLTLTYNDICLPWADHPEQEFPIPVLQKSDFQKFIKRLRKISAKRYPDLKLKYYAVGEYGGVTSRPHYHAIVFSLRKELLSELQNVWSLGFVHTGSVTNDSIDYVTKYVVNKYEYKHYLVPPFACISNGIGLFHLQQNYDRYDNEDVVVNSRGYKQTLPRYYRNKLPTNHKILEDAKKAKTKAKFYEREKEELERLEKLHPDSRAYYDERKVANNDRILRAAKKGQSL